ncbi:unnamed protein product [Alopecurus aequalis]
MLILTWILSIFPFVRRLLLKFFGAEMPVPSPSDGGSSDVRRQLESRLSKESYLIVIDDVRTKEVYSGICTYAWANKVGGRIIVTTDIQPAARACICGNPVLPLVPDSSTAGLVLVGEVGVMSYEDACFALCAAAVARTQGSLRTDYQRVVLEDCLLYFCMFPRDHDVRRNPLIRRWLAEGIIVYAKRKVPEYVYRFDEDIVADHLDILIGHNIIKSVKKSNNGKVKRCQPPGIVFNHICGKAVIENFISLLCGSTKIEDLNQASVRRLSLHPNSCLAPENGGINAPNVSRLRTIVVFPATRPPYGAILRFDKHKLLRVLDLKQCPGLKDRQILIICELELLKYLSLGNSIERLPRKIGRLIRLETLDMRTTDVVTVYSEVLMLPKLKHLLGKFRLSSCDCPDEKPNLVKKLLGHKDELKDFLRKNSVLETLSGIFIGNGLGLPQLFRHMLRLRKVKIWCDSTTKGSTDLTDLKRGIKVFTDHRRRMPNIDYSLSIDFNGSSQLFQYCLEDAGMLTSLKLSGNVTLSAQVNTTLLISVQELCLSWTNLSGATIQNGLSNLRCQLKFLKLVENNLVGFAVKKNAPFLNLERLCLVGVQSLDEIIIQGLSKLISMHLLCQTLGGLPDIQIGSLQNLKEVGLHSGVDGDIRRGWEDAATNHPRKPNVVSIVETTY